MRDITLEDTFTFDFTTRAFATGIPTVLSNTPVLSAKEGANATPITAGVSVAVDTASVVGLNEGTVVATAANGFEAGKSYAIYISTGTVDSVSVIGEVVQEFTIALSAAAVDLANSTDGLTAAAASLAVMTDAFVLTSAVIETVTSQTQFVLPATVDATDNEAYHGALAVFIDGTDPNQKSFRIIEAYTASTRTVTVSKAPDFTITTADTMTILATTDAGGVWDMLLTGNKHNIATSAGRRLRQLEEAFVLAEGVIATQTDGRTLTLDTGAVDTADFYIGARLQIEEGTGAGQTRIIVAYSAARVVLLDSVWVTNPDNASRYSIVASDVHVSVSDADLAEGLVAVATSTTQVTLDSGALADANYYNEMLIIFTHGTGAGQATHITNYTVGRVVTMSPALDTAVGTDTIYHIQAVVPISQVVDETWDEAFGGHVGSGTFGSLFRGLVQEHGTISDTGNDTTHVHLSGLTYGDDELNGWTIVIRDNSLGEYHQAFITDWVLSTELATVQVQNGGALPFTPQNNADLYYLVTPATVSGILDEAVINHEKQGSVGERFASVLSGNAATGTLSTTQMSTDIVEATNDHFIGRTIIWMSGVLKYQATDITDYVGTNGVFTFTAVTEAPSNGDNFIIV